MSSPVICIGSALIDELYYCVDKTVPATSNPASLKRHAGGVARNIAEHLALLEIPIQLVTVLGNDPDGEWLFDECKKSGIGMVAVLRVDDPTGKYASILDADGSLYAAACTDPCAKFLTGEYLSKQRNLLLTAKLIIADTNLESDTLVWLSGFCKENKLPLVIEPVSVAKARKLSMIDLSGVFMITPNEDELYSLSGSQLADKEKVLDDLFNRGLQNIWFRQGKEGSTLISLQNKIQLTVPAISITDSTGAGDAALAGWIAGFYHGVSPMACLQSGHALAMDVLQVHGAVIKDINSSKLSLSIKKYYPDGQ